MGMVGDLVFHCDRKMGQKWAQNGDKIFLLTRVDEGVAGGQRNVAAPRLMCSRGKLSAESSPNPLFASPLTLLRASPASEGVDLVPCESLVAVPSEIPHR